MSDWTSGPWKVVAGNRIHADGVVVAVAGTWPRPPDMHHSFPRWEADARLIAAAPELHAALRKMTALGTGGGSHWREAWERAHAALAKAEGREEDTP